MPVTKNLGRMFSFDTQRQFPGRIENQDDESGNFIIDPLDQTQQLPCTQCRLDAPRKQAKLINVRVARLDEAVSMRSTT